MATGDTNQLAPIDLLSNTMTYETYSNHCINTIFPNAITLKENKRLKTAEDKEILKQFKADIFNDDIPFIETIKKLG